MKLGWAVTAPLLRLLLVLASCPAVVRSSSGGAEDNCAAFAEDGYCVDPKRFYVTGLAINGTRSLVEASKDLNAASVFDQFIEPLIDIAMEVSLNELETDAFCFGAFDGRTLKEGALMDWLGCSALPVKAGLQYGTISGQIPIPPFLQKGLVPLSLWTKVRDYTEFPIFCMGLRVPTSSCYDVTFGVSLNKDAINTLAEVMPSGGWGESILILMKAILEVEFVDDPVTFAFSLGEGLHVPVKYFTDRKYIDEDFHAHLYFSSLKLMELPFMGCDFDKIVSIDGPYQRGFHLGNTTNTVELQLARLLDPNEVSRHRDKEDILNYVESIVEAYPEVITTKGNLTVDLEAITRGLFPSIMISGKKNPIRALKLNREVGDVHAGFYVHSDVEMAALKEIVVVICVHFEGLLLAVSGKGCPDVTNDNKEGKLGLEIRKEVMELMIEWPGFFLRCKMERMESDNPITNCQIDDVVFGILEEDKGYIIGKSHSLNEKIEQQISAVSKDSVNLWHGFTKEIAVTSLLSEEVNPIVFEPVAKYFGADSNTSRTDVAFRFEPNFKCKERTHRLWSSRDKRVYKHHFSQVGNDDTRASCFLSCYKWYQQNPAYISSSDLCCSFEELHDSNECRVGHKGQEKASDKRKSATMSFVKDFQGLRDLSVAGSECKKGEDCFSGFCDNNVCKYECAPDNQCFPSPSSKCFGNDVACLNINGVHHYCDQGTDACVCDATSGACSHEHTVTTLGLIKPTLEEEKERERRLHPPLVALDKSNDLAQTPFDDLPVVRKDDILLFSDEDNFLE